MHHNTDHVERAILLKLAIRTGILILAGFLLSTLMFVLLDKDYVKEIPLNLLASDHSEIETTLQTSLEANADIVSLVSTEFTEQTLRLTLRPVSAGQAMISIGDPSAMFGPYVFALIVTKSGTIIDIENGCYPHWRLGQGIVITCIGIFCVLLWLAFAEARRKRLYSYLCVFFSGFAVWITVITVLQTIVLCSTNSILSVMSSLGNSGFRFMILTLPFCIVFAGGLCISNLSLLRHEGKSMVNILGFALSLAILLGQAGNILLYSQDFAGSEMEQRIHNALLSIGSSLYVLLECFLIGVIICGILAVRRKPNYDADYVIILGCAIRKDGTLYPLLRGRVDRALAFVRAQKEQTGKQAILVPSGGQGNDEIISEAEAMTRYLLEQGVPQEQILPENRSANTAQNMRFSRDLILAQNPDAKVVFSTTNYHVFRSGLISRQAGFAPEGIGSQTKWYYWPNAAIREWIGMLSYLWKIMVLILLAMIIVFVGLNLLLPM